jgi:hypothetical protein
MARSVLVYATVGNRESDESDVDLGLSHRRLAV